MADAVWRDGGNSGFATLKAMEKENARPKRIAVELELDKPAQKDGVNPEAFPWRI